MVAIKKGRAKIIFQKRKVFFSPVCGKPNGDFDKSIFRKHVQIYRVRVNVWGGDKKVVGCRSYQLGFAALSAGNERGSSSKPHAPT